MSGNSALKNHPAHLPTATSTFTRNKGKWEVTSFSHSLTANQDLPGSVEGFVDSGNAHVLDSSFFNINHWARCYSVIAFPSAKKHIFTVMEQLDRKYLRVCRVYFINQLEKSRLLLWRSWGRRGKAKTKNELNSVLAVAAPSAKAVMRYCRAVISCINAKFHLK